MQLWQKSVPTEVTYCFTACMTAMLHKMLPIFRRPEEMEVRRCEIQTVRWIRLDPPYSQDWQSDALPSNWYGACRYLVRRERLNVSLLTLVIGAFSSARVAM